MTIPDYNPEDNSYDNPKNTQMKTVNDSYMMTTQKAIPDDNTRRQSQMKTQNTTQMTTPI